MIFFTAIYHISLITLADTLLINIFSQSQPIFELVGYFIAFSKFWGDLPQSDSFVIILMNFLDSTKKFRGLNWANFIEIAQKQL